MEETMIKNLEEKTGKKFSEWISIVQKSGLGKTTKTRLDVGLSLKAVKPQGKLEASRSFSAMCTHRIKVEHESEINRDLVKWLKNACEQAG